MAKAEHIAATPAGIDRRHGVALSAEPIDADNDHATANGNTATFADFVRHVHEGKGWSFKQIATATDTTYTRAYATARRNRRAP